MISNMDGEEMFVKEGAQNLYTEVGEEAERGDRKNEIYDKQCRGKFRFV